MDGFQFLAFSYCTLARGKKFTFQKLPSQRSHHDRVSSFASLRFTSVFTLAFSLAVNRNQNENANTFRELETHGKRNQSRPYNTLLRLLTRVKHKAEIREIPNTKPNSCTSSSKRLRRKVTPEPTKTSTSIPGSLPKPPAAIS